MTSRRLSESDLHALVDGELAPEERDELEAALASSPADVELVRQIRDLNDALEQRYPVRTDDPLPERFKPALRGLARRNPPVGRWAAWGCVAALLMLMAGAAGYTLRGPVAEQRGEERQFADSAVGAHRIYTAEVRHAVEVKADEAHLVRWLAKRLGADVRAPALTDQGWRLMGGRLLPDHGLPAAQFMYEDASGRRLTLYVRRETGLNNTAFRFYEKEGLGSFYWIDRPLAYALSGRLSRDELMTLANVVYAQLESQDPAKAPTGAGRPQ
jgi:anti-sigma factor RsiW